MNKKKKSVLMEGICICLLVGWASISEAFVVNGTVTCNTPVGWVPWGARVDVIEVDPLPGNSFHTNVLGSTYVSNKGTFSLTFLWSPVVGPPTPPDYESGNPDLIFKIYQNSDNSVNNIYNEEPEVDTIWNLSDGSWINIEVDSPFCVCWNPNDPITPSAAPLNNTFTFTEIGIRGVDIIDCRGDVATSTGYLRPSPTFSGLYSNQPFGTTLHLRGWFGALTGVNRYKIQYSEDGVNFTDINSPLSKKYLAYIDGEPVWMSEAMGPFSEGGEGGLVNLYKLPYVEDSTKIWQAVDILANFDTTKVANGICTIRVLGYYWNGATHTIPTSTLQIDQAYGKIKLQIDNTHPQCEILEVRLNGSEVEPCNIITLGTASTDNLEVRFKAYDLKGHLHWYALNAMYGHNCYVAPKPTTPDKAEDDYGNHIDSTRKWQGSWTYSTKYYGGTYTDCVACVDCPPQVSYVMPTCAYQIRLRVDKRTDNGYGRVYWGYEDTWHITIKRQ